MVGIGMNFGATPVRDPDIEETLLLASEEGMLKDDLRVLSLLVHWFEIHQARVNADRLVRMVRDHSEGRVRAFWAAVGAWLHKDRRFSRISKLYHGPRIDLLPVGTDFQVARSGEDDRFAGSCLRVPSGTLRHRKGDVLPPDLLVQEHAGYRNRVRMGPSWRADVWTALEAEPESTAAEAARRVNCAFATAWAAKQDFELFRRHAPGSRPVPKLGRARFRRCRGSLFSRKRRYQQ